MRRGQPQNRCVKESCSIWDKWLQMNSRKGATNYLRLNKIDVAITTKCNRMCKLNEAVDWIYNYNECNDYSQRSGIL